MTRKSLTERIPSKPEESTVSAKVPTELYEKVQKLLKANHTEWKALIKAALEQYVDEQKGA